MNLESLRRQAWASVYDRIEPTAVAVAHAVQQWRLTRERQRARAGQIRIVSTACWDFPIYSQTFVYQEQTQLIRQGFGVRFLYSKQNAKRNLPAQFSPLWRSRRRAVLHWRVAQRDYAYYHGKMPERVDALIAMLANASGLAPGDVLENYHVRQAFAFTRMVEAARPDYLHSYFFYEGSLFALCASYLLGIPRGVSCYADHMLNDYAFKLVPLHLEQCAIVIATSARIKRELQRIAPNADPSRILVKPNAINAAAFPVTPRAEPSKGEPFRLVSLSRLEPKKGIHYLMDAVGILRTRGLNVELHVLGAADDSAASRDYARRLETQVDELGLRGVVHLEGRQTETEIKRFFARAHVYIAPFVETEHGDKDGIPTSLLEGMATGLPVVVTDAGSMAEVVEHDRDGLMVPQRDPTSLANALDRLFQDPRERERLGRAGANRVRTEFDVSVCEGAFHERLRTLTAIAAPFTAGGQQ